VAGRLIEPCRARATKIITGSIMKGQGFHIPI
jgi:hypothetical protein